MNSVLNVSAYRFFPKGTILLATEVINLLLAGAPDAVRSFVAALRMEAKESRSSRHGATHRRSRAKS